MEFPTHTCRPSQDPTRNGRCACGKRIHSLSARPPVTEERALQRSIPMEREITEFAASPYPKYVARALIRFAEDRIREGPVRFDPGRDMVQETREELADARNYLCWIALKAAHDRADNEDEIRAAIARCLQAIIEAWELVIDIEDLLD